MANYCGETSLQTVPEGLSDDLSNYLLTPEVPQNSVRIAIKCSFDK